LGICAVRAAIKRIDSSACWARTTRTLIKTKERYAKEHLLQKSSSTRKG